jgi:hypothetical protein
MCVEAGPVLGAESDESRTFARKSKSALVFAVEIVPTRHNRECSERRLIGRAGSFSERFTNIITTFD